MTNQLRIANIGLSLILILQILVWTFRERPSQPTTSTTPQPAASSSAESGPGIPDPSAVTPTSSAAPSTPAASPSSSPVAAKAENGETGAAMETASDGNSGRRLNQTEASAGGESGKDGSTRGRHSKSESREASRAEAAEARSEIGARLSRLGLKPARFQIVLLWDSDADLDLHVVTESGERLWRQDRDSRSGGRFQSTAADERKPLEVVYWSDEDEPAWPVTIEIRYPPPENESALAVAYRVVVSFDGGTEKSYSGEIAPSRAITLGPFDRNADEADR